MKLYKADFTAAVAEKAGISKAEATRILEASLGVATDALARGDSITLTGFGTLETRRRNARSVKNPQTGEMMVVPEKTVAAFKAGNTLSERVSGKP